LREREAALLGAVERRADTDVAVGPREAAMTPAFVATAVWWQGWGEL
jgi:hypothetical protein